jgi:hypothetical protein
LFGGHVEQRGFAAIANPNERPPAWAGRKDRCGQIPLGVLVDIDVVENSEVQVFHSGWMGHRDGEIHQAEKRNVNRPGVKFVRNGANDIVESAIGALNNSAGK